MRTDSAGEMVASLVEAARRGRPDAWPALIGRFQDVAVAVALGRLGDVEAARDASQDAFRLAFQHLDDLAEPAAFPGWFMRLVATACHRQRRRRGAVAVPLAEVPVAADPANVVVARDEAARVRAAVEALPEPERLVVALHYLAGMTYPEVAAFLGIGLSAAKKRAYTARARLKELLPMAADLLAHERPSRDGRFRDTILLFAAIRRRDRDAVARLLRRDPGLAHAHEDWSADEAFAAGLPLAGHASPLIRAAGAGDLALTRLLVAAGAEPGAPCSCAGAETPLWSATLAGAADVVRFLLERGADPDAAAFAGATPLHVAAMRGRPELARLLRAAGADPTRADGGGRLPADWRPRDNGPLGRGGDFLATGVRAIDLFAPLRRGGLQRWPAAYGLGQFVVLAEIARAVAPERTWWIGFEQGVVDRAEIEHLLTESGIPGEVRLVPRGAGPAAARASFERTVDEIVRADPPLLAICLEAPGHAHDVAIALPRLAGAPGVLAALVVEPYAGAWPAAARAVPEGYDGQVAFDRGRLDRGLHPAIDPLTTLAREYPSERHARLAAAARRADADERLARYLAQPLTVAEPFTSRPGESTPLDELLDRIEEILA